MTHRLWLPLALVTLMTGTTQAQVDPGWGGYGPAGAPARTTPAQHPGAEAAGTLKAGMDKLLAYLGQKDAPNKLQAAAFLDREIAPSFDFLYMAQWVAGPAWASMGEQDRKAMAAKIESSFLSSLATQMGGYDGQQVRYLRPRPGPNGSVKVPVGILRPGAYPAKMTFRMYRSADGWKVYDVEANGRSAATYFRTQMSQTDQPVRAPGPRPAQAR
jgi:phospholipid transport system substrate-binding protein